MSIISGQFISVSWSPKTTKWYLSLGYKFTKKGDSFKVPVEHLSVGNMSKIKATCDYCGAKFEKSYFEIIKGRSIVNKDNCKKCFSKKLKEVERMNKISNGNTLANKFPNLLLEWDWEANVGIDPYSITSSVGTVVWWKCANKHKWMARVADRTGSGRLNGTGCPYCSGKLVTEERSVSSNQSLLSHWNYDKNTNISPSECSAGSNKVVWWKCSQGHEWESVVNDLLTSLKKGYMGCPYCTGRKVCADNCLSATHPEIAEEWNYTLNKGMKPEDFTSGSHRKVFWICENNHTWKSQIYNRTSRDRKCPYCANKKVCHENCLQTLFPAISSQWHPTKNKLSPSKVLSGSSKKVWWICEEGHEWEATISNRTGKNKSGCPQCASTLHSKGEAIIRNYLTSNHYLFKEQVRFNDCRNKNPLPFDFVIYNDLDGIRHIIEFDGKQHEEPIEWFGGTKAFNYLKANDEIKNKYCKDKGIPITRIQYRDINLIDSILDSNLTESQTYS